MGLKILKTTSKDRNYGHVINERRMTQHVEEGSG
jgi:hypothetical protein